VALRLYTRFVALSTAVLIFAGGLVTSTGSGLSVPDWPNTYGWFMYTFPLEKMVGGIRYEHSYWRRGSGAPSRGHSSDGSAMSHWRPS
jgi:hypothetical protein